MHVWLVHQDEARDPDLLPRYHALMTPDEAARQRRFMFERGRHEFLLTRALVRTTLSRYAAVAPEDWRPDTERARAVLDTALAEAEGLVNARPRALAVVTVLRALGRNDVRLDDETRARLDALYANLRAPW